MILTQQHVIRMTSAYHLDWALIGQEMNLEKDEAKRARDKNEILTTECPEPKEGCISLLHIDMIGVIIHFFIVMSPSV